MEPEIQPRRSRSDKMAFTIFVSILMTALVVGVGVYFWQRAFSETVSFGLVQETDALEEQLYELRSEYNALINRKSADTVLSVSDTSYNLINDKCTADECLFNIGHSDYPLGTAVIKGYYSSVERDAWGETKNCDAFTITDGSAELIRAMVDLVDSGNGVHSKNEMNQPIINLGLDIISHSEKQNIVNSSESNQIELVVLDDSPPNVGVHACYEDVVVLRIK